MAGASAGVVETATPAPVTDLAPVTVAGAARWLLLLGDGGIGRWDVASGSFEQVAASSVPAENGETGSDERPPRPRLHASADGRFAAVVTDYGRHGQVLDLRTGEVTMTLDNAYGEEWTVPFALAFLSHAGRTVMVHRTEWNRLDVSDPATGELLTPRDLTGHHLDYFHGALHVSPDGERILDDGWVWHPFGAPTVWSVPRWLTHNVWESEDAALPTCDRDYYWDCAMTWIDGTRLAIGGLGNHVDAILPGARVFEVSGAAAVEVATIPGPAGRFFSDGGSLFSTDAGGLHRWDPAGGERLGTVPGITPTHHHRAGGVFLELRGDTVLTWAQAVTTT
ncbi:hypothetical protein ACFO1B_01200 [Dactylosporangium siamense]|uniref:Uncharacterized protein n=1 Tax=Dactylosporangium siamense TaxID=685454 RepID=A0A919PC45_9ACTN|nr:hypothetical protein [Dactylosporangium siamense]GIG42030.1 hypothetical protein Dsi01nite_000710 [Dactylosporangium siamense]